MATKKDDSKTSAAAPAGATAPETKPAATGATGPAVRVTSKLRAGYGCIQRRFTTEPTVIPLAELKPGQLERLKACPHLSVIDVKS